MSIKIKDLRHVYDPGTPYELMALEDINLNINDGEIIGLIGHTGSGKSTLMQHLNGLLKPSSGSIEIEGITITKEKQNLRDLRKKVGLVFQYPEYQLFEETVKKDVAFGPGNIGIPASEIDELVSESLKSVGLDVEEIGEKAPFELSGGQKRKVAIAGVLAMKPKVLILDEPTAGLDPKSRDELLCHIHELHQKENMTIIFVTHSMEDVARLADRLVVMHKSKIVYDDVPRQVFKHSEHLQSIGLDVPELTKLVYKLNEKGFSIDDSLITFEEIKNAILQQLREK
ncbi:energy-coupling factor transporter ATPase [Acidaminobacter sp. JC074]|uniref:energy-coupling factor transporter ATPase n=1 Tax=Acidaminobacter sp. JC074 TaxID=2530199 RepID=UPI001F10DB1B|nr:energy-coupling factor transporter ATPase [Acidaminobacter sp. JC074]MCH4890517.1 energy-coupling factor transporter ATPase [Acidaminobacter sp. JC074]